MATSAAVRPFVTRRTSLSGTLAHSYGGGITLNARAAGITAARGFLEIRRPRGVPCESAGLGAIAAAASAPAMRKSRRERGADVKPGRSTRAGTSCGASLTWDSLRRVWSAWRRPAAVSSTNGDQRRSVTVSGGRRRPGAAAVAIAPRTARVLPSEYHTTQTMFRHVHSKSEPAHSEGQACAPPNSSDRPESRVELTDGEAPGGLILRTVFTFLPSSKFAERT